MNDNESQGLSDRADEFGAMVTKTDTQFSDFLESAAKMIVAELDGIRLALRITYYEQGEGYTENERRVGYTDNEIDRGVDEDVG
jgi:hypothetical protein